MLQFALISENVNQYKGQWLGNVLLGTEIDIIFNRNIRFQFHNIYTKSQIGIAEF